MDYGLLQVPFSESGNRYSIPLLNALVLYCGSQHITVIRARGQTPNMSTVAHTSHMDIFQNLAVDLDTEGRYLFLNALANQLRFPSSHTHYFSLIILYLFAQSNTEVVQVILFSLFPCIFSSLTNYCFSEVLMLI